MASNSTAAHAKITPSLCHYRRHRLRLPGFLSRWEQQPDDDDVTKQRCKKLPNIDAISVTRRLFLSKWVKRSFRYKLLNISDAAARGPHVLYHQGTTTLRRSVQVYKNQSLTWFKFGPAHLQGHLLRPYWTFLDHSLEDLFRKLSMVNINIWLKLKKLTWLSCGGSSLVRRAASSAIIESVWATLRPDLIPFEFIFFPKMKIKPIAS